MRLTSDPKRAALAPERERRSIKGMMLAAVLLAGAYFGFLYLVAGR